jgi:hypothetical protein
LSQIRRVDIEGIPKGAVLAALYNRSSYFGGGGGGRLNPVRGEELFRRDGPSFDRLNGCLLRIDLSGASFDPTRYDEHLGEGAAAVPIRHLREAGSDGWEFPQRSEPGMRGTVFWRKQAPGAISNASSIVKVGTDLDDQEHLELTGAVDGDRGVVIGSILLPWGEGGVTIPPETGYYIEWDHDPKVVYAVSGSCIAASNDRKDGV